jgi:hypothetical protein
VWSRSAWCSSCLSLVLEHLLFDPFFQQFLVAVCLADGPRKVHGQSAWCAVLTDGPRCLHGWSVIEGAILVVRELIMDGPPQTRGQSA